MLFSSVEFLFRFLPVFMLLYLFIPEKYRNIVLLSGSLLFYAAGEPYYVLLLILSILINYGAGKLILDKEKKTAKNVLILSLIYNFGMLFIFKYWDFAAGILNRLSAGETIPVLSLSLPLGISFYTFQIVSYVIDVYLRKIEADKSFINFGAYLSMFPQLIAGPIVIYSDIRDALEERSFSISSFDNGLKTFIIGLGYKVIIANRIGTLWNEVCTIGFESISTPLAWLGAFAYSMQLYFDFCGYSMMAVGLGEMLGFEIPVNFRHPYTSRSVTDFWRRWHITLGAWFREYVYIPLGGNRCGKVRTILNLFIVWFLTGFWHGADWNFILWGLSIFVLLVIEKTITYRLLNADNILAKLISHTYMFVYILVSWTIFAISDFSELWTYLGKMFSFTPENLNITDFSRLLITYAPLLVASIIFSTSFPEKLFDKVRGNLIGIGIAFIVFWYSVYYLSIGLNNPFLYLRF